MRDAAIDDDGLVDALIDGVGHALDLGQHTARNDARGLVTSISETSTSGMSVDSSFLS